MTEPTMLERCARAIARGCNLDPDAISLRTAEQGHTIPEWLFFMPAARLVLDELSTPDEAMIGAWEKAEECADHPVEYNLNPTRWRAAICEAQKGEP